MLTLVHLRGLSTDKYRINSNLVIIALFALLVALIPSVPQLEAAPRAQPELIALAQQQPQAIIGVIVQKNLAGTNVKQRVSQLGGTITSDLHIINAFAARLAGQAALTLVRMDGVRWISLDSPTIKTSVCNSCVDTANLINVYNRAIGADQLWNESPKYLQGQGVGVAVVDSSIQYGSDLYTVMGQLRVSASIQVNSCGYPQGLAGEQTPLEARILAVCDAVEAMALDRPYQRAMSLEEIIAEVQRGRGTHFDPMLADAFMRIAEREGTRLLINSAEQVTRKQSSVLHGHSLPEQILRFGNERT